MKEYVPGQGSYKVEEGGALTGIPTSSDVDVHSGTLVFDRDDVKVKARGVDIALSSRFNSDHVYSTVIPKISKNDGPSAPGYLPTGGLGIPIPNSLMTLPNEQSSFYRICNGWSWKLPFLYTGLSGNVTAGNFVTGYLYMITSIGTTNFTTIGATTNSVGTYFYATGLGSGTGTARLAMSDVLKFTMGDGKIFDMICCLTDEAGGITPQSPYGWRADNGHGKGTNGQSSNGLGTGIPGNHTWTESFEVSWAVENTSGVSQVTVVIPEIQVTLQFDVLRSPNGTPGYDCFTPLMDSNLKMWLADGKVITFTTNGFVSKITDPAKINSLTFSYVTDSISGIVVSNSANTRKIITLSASDYAACLPGDNIIINGEIRVIFMKLGNYQVQVSPNFDSNIPSTAGPYPGYTICKGQIQMITHTDGRAVKFYYYQQTVNSIIYNVMAILVSSDQTYSDFIAGDKFVGYYMFDINNRLASFNVPTDPTPPHAINTTNFVTDLASNQATYFVVLQTVSYSYNLTSAPTPSTDYITVTNNVGAPTIYYFAAGGFSSHSWNNAYFFKGTCRRGGTTNVLFVERPDFYFAPNSYLNINRISDQAFFNASKAAYETDENAQQFQDDNAFSIKMFNEQQAIAGLSTAASLLGLANGFPGSLFNLATQGASMEISSAQFQYQQAKYQKDRDIAAHAGNVSAWTPISTIPSPNKIVLSSALATAPLQNDVYAVINAAPDKTSAVIETSKNASRIYIDYTNGSTPFKAGDFIALRTEMVQISNAGTDTGFTGNKFVDVSTPFSFIPDVGEQAAFYYANSKLPSNLSYWCFYLNKPKVVRTEIHYTTVPGLTYWRRKDYEYQYAAQGSAMADNFVSAGFTVDNIEGPNLQTFDASDITLTGAVVTTGISNIADDIDFLKETYTFQYDGKSFHKGADTVTSTRLEDGGTQWLFVSKAITAFGRPCYNADYHGPMGVTYFEGGNPAQAGGGAAWRKKIVYRYDVYGRKVLESLISSSLGGKQVKNTFTQYVGSSAYLAATGASDMDPLNKFSANYLSGNYQVILNSFHALSLVGAVIEDVDTWGNQKIVFNEFESTYMNLIMSDSVILSSLNTWKSQFANNLANMNGWIGGTEYAGTLLSWSLPSYQSGAQQSDFSTAVYDDPHMITHALTYFGYDTTTNNLLTIQKPMGNVVTLSYVTGWLSSYVASDYRTLDQNMNLPGGTTQYVVTSYAYDILGRLTSKAVRFKTDTLANDTNLVSYGSHDSKTQVDYTYDGLGRVLGKSVGDGGITQAQQQVLAVQYLDAGDASYPSLPYMISTDYLGFRVKSYFDTRYRLVNVRKFKPDQALSGIGGMAYTSLNEIGISSEQNIYDSISEKTAQNVKFTNVAETQGLTTRYTYDRIGRVTRVDSMNTDPAYGGDSIYHTRKVISYDEGANAVVTQEYTDDVSGNFIQTRVENDWLGRGPVREISWTAMNGLGLQRVTRSQYRYDGRLAKKTLPNGQVYQYNYDTVGHLEEMVYPDSTFATWMYDYNGNIVQTINRRRLAVVMAYNKSDLPISKKTVDSVRGNSVLTMVYTQLGPSQIIKTENAANIFEKDMWYHLSGGILTLQQIIDGDTLQLINTFDAAGNQLSMEANSPTGMAWSQTVGLNPLYHPVSPEPHTNNFNDVCISVGSNPVITQQKNYAGLLASIVFGDGNGATLSNLSYSYDKFMNVINILSSDAALDLNLTRDFLGDILTKKEPSNGSLVNNAYTYDGMSRLSSGEGSFEAYDELSNLVMKGPLSFIQQNSTVAGKDQMRLTSYFDGTNNHTMAYDADANVTAIGSRFAALKYDNFNHLREIDLQSGQIDLYWYDEGGMRIKKVEDFTGANNKYYYLYVGNTAIIIEHYAGATKVDTRFNLVG
jgi:YD repeat-containing protein